MRRLDRFLLRELMGPFFFSVFLFGSVLISGRLLFQLIDLIAKQGVGVEVALELFSLQLPQILVFTFPMSMMLGTLMSLNRLSADSEAVALLASGASPGRMAVPIVTFGAVVFFAALLVNEYVTPATLLRAARLKVEFVEKGHGVKENLLVQESEGDTQRVIYAGRLDLKSLQMQGVSLLELKSGRPVFLFSAETAQYSKQRGWLFYNGTIRGLGRKSGTQREATFGEAGFPVKIVQTPQQLAKGKADPNQMTMAELSSAIGQLEGAGKNVNELRVKLNDKLSMPFSAVTFGLLGVPLGISKGRSKSTAMGFSLAVLLIFMYWVVWLSLGMIGHSGAIPPGMASWGANAIFLTFGACMLWQRGR